MAEDEGKARLGGVIVPEFLRPTYSNYANVNHTPWDFRLVFAVVKTPMPGSEKEAFSGELHPEAVAEVILPANLMHGFITALQTNFSSYLEQYGPPGMDPEGPRPPEE